MGPHTRHEIERKFLVRKSRLPDLGTGARITQGYLSRKPAVRIRIATKAGVEAAWITIKGKGSVMRPEYEYEIPVEDARGLMSMCQYTPIEKIRYEVDHGGKTWEIDEFLGPHKGLWVTEIELSGMLEKFPLPPWAGEEVSSDPRYTNAALCEAGKIP